MKEHGRVQSAKCPEQKVIDDYSVWLATDIVPVSALGTDEQPGFEGYEYTLTQYDKDEYIAMIDDANTALQQQVEATQSAVDFLLLGAE